MTRTRKIAGTLLLLVPLMLPVLAEVGLALIRHVPLLRPPGPLLQTARVLYLQHRDTIQYLPECARYDPETSYVLKRGACRFASDEFDTTIRVNRLGLRDDEESLARPDMVVLGDSYAMGWGVENEEAFASVIEASTGLRVLNAAISSYGTARELALLRRIDTSAMRYLVIQYAGNDYPENLTYVQNDGRLDIMSEESYDALVRWHESRRSYYPGMYLKAWLRARRTGMTAGQPGALLSWWTAAAWAQPPAPPQTRDEVKVFLDVLSKSPVALDGVQVVVLALACPGDFVDELRQQIKAGDFPAYIRTMKASHLGPLLSGDVYFHLDDHLRPRGHAIIAERVREMLEL